MQVRYILIQIVIALSVVGPAPVRGYQIAEFPLPADLSGGFGNPDRAIVQGSDGNMWFLTASGGPAGGRIARVTPTGDVTSFLVPDANPERGLAAGPDGNLWFTTAYPTIGKITPQGAVTQYPLPFSDDIDYQPAQITAGPDGNLWFTDRASISPLYSGRIGKISTSGEITMYPIPYEWEMTPFDIVAGPDGNLWFTGGSYPSGGAVARLSTSGDMTRFLINGGNAVPLGITVGPDGRVWFAGTYVGAVSMDGAVSVVASLGLSFIASGPDGHLWGTHGSNTIARVTTAGDVRIYPTSFVNPDDLSSIARGPDETLWLTTRYSRSVVRLRDLADVSSNCQDQPLANCYQAQENALQVTTGSRPKVLWKWKAGYLPLPEASLGDPVAGSTGYRVCMYDQWQGVSRIVMGADMNPAESCGRRPCWRKTARKLTYRNKAGVALSIKTGEEEQPSLKLTSKRNWTTAPQPVQPGVRFFANYSDVVVQISRTDDPSKCWTSTFREDAVRRNDGGAYRGEQQY